MPSIARQEHTDTSLHSKLLEYSIAGIIVSAILVILIRQFGVCQFGGYDQGILVDEAYRLYSGQRPYIDFPSTQPILFYLGSLWALQIFGLSWTAFVDFAAVFCATTFAIHLTLLWRLQIPRVWAISLAFCVQLGTMVLASFWWYNPMGAVLVAMLCTAALLVLKHPEDLLNWVIYAGCLFLTSLAKPNVAGFTILFCSLAILFNKQTRRKGVLFSLLAVAASLALLACYRINPLNIIHFYFGAAGRAIPRWSRFIVDCDPWLIKTQTTLLIAVVLPLAALIARARISIWPLLALAGGIASGIFGCFTNGELRAVDLSIVLNSVGLICLISKPREKTGQLLTPLILQAGAMLFLSCFSLWIGVTRFRIRQIGPGMFYERPPLFCVNDLNPFFSGLQTGPILINTLTDITNTLQNIRKTTGREPNVFFGPRLNWAYAAFNLPPPKNIPYAWYSGLDYPESMLPEILTAFTNHHFDYCIFLGTRYDRNAILTFMPDEILSSIRNNYEETSTNKFIRVLQRKSSAAHESVQPPEIR